MDAQAISPAVQQDYRSDLVVGAPPTFLSFLDLIPVRQIGAGVARANAAQAVKSYVVLKAAAATTQTQIATSSASTRIFYLGAQVCATESGDDVYIEDASTGAITPTDNSTVGLFYATSNETAIPLTMGMAPRECKRGIRLQMTKSGTANTVVIVWYLEERRDGQQQAL